MVTVKNDPEAAVFKSVYESSEQRRLRLLALLMLGCKHGIRGVILSWPLYFLALLPFLIPVENGWWVLLFVFPALLVSGNILLMGVLEEYTELVRGKLIKSSGLAELFWGDLADS